MDFVGITAAGWRAAFGPEAIIYALAAIGINMHYGYTGLLNLGQVGFMLLGAYSVAVTVSVWGASLWVGLLVALATSIVLALLLGIPTLRLRADYLAITTIAAAEILRIGARARFAEPLTGGVFGLTRFADAFYDLNPLPDGRYGFGRFGFDDRRLWLVLVGWALVLLAIWLVRALMRAPWGRVVLAIREDEMAAASLGKNVYWYKLQVLVLGGVIGALGGVVLAVNQQAVAPGNFVAAVTFFAYTALILGGRGKLWGPVVGAMLFWFVIAFVDNALREAIDNDLIPSGLIGTEQIGIVRFMLVGLALMLLMIFRPQGLLGRSSERFLEAT